MDDKTRRWVSGVDLIAGAIRETFVIVAMTVGLVIASLPPAIILSTALATRLATIIGAGWANVTGILFAILLETTGVVSSHIAILEYRKEQLSGRFQVMVTVATLYLIAGIISIWIFDKDAIIRLSGTLAYLVAFMIYISSGMMYDMRRVEQEAQEKIIEEHDTERDELEWQRRQKELQDEREFQLKLAQKEANRAVRLAKVGSPLSVPTTDVTKTKEFKITPKAVQFLKYLQDNPQALRNKYKIHLDTGISRPTIDKYIKDMSGVYFKSKNGLVTWVKSNDEVNE